MSKEPTDEQIAEGRKSLEPFIESLFRQRAAIIGEGRRPAWIEVPRSFAEIFDGGYVMGLPVRRTDVSEPTVFGGAVTTRFVLDPP
jgi:hypothetical protein